MMGVIVSSIVIPWGKHRKTLEELQKVILEYLRSDDYSTDPHKHFGDIAKYGYSTLEEFISEIPINAVTELRNSRGIDANQVPAQLGMRYVHVNETWRKGSLVKLLVLPKGNIAIIQTDTSTKPNRNIFQKMFTIVSYFMFPPLFLLKVFRQYYMLTDSSTEFECKFEELQLEKEHLLAFLRQTETGNHNHLVQVHLHGTPRAGQPHPPSSTLQTRVVDQTVPNFEPQLTGDNTQPQTKTKKKRKRNLKSKPEKVDVVNEAKSQLRTNGFNGIDAVRTDDDGLSASGVSQIEQTFEKLAPVGMQRGIEGAYNSCYMDSMLVSMFYTTNIFDFLLVPKSTDSKFSKKTRRILRERVVTPLREIYFCDYESLYVLRQHLSRLNEDLMGAFMDAEQVLYLLCDEVFKEQHFIQYAGVDEDGWGDYMHLMSIDAEDPSKVITVQRNLETSFAFNGDIRMARVPNPAFILGMPRSNRELIHYEAVIPNTEVEIKHLLQNAECNFCHGDADWEVQNRSLDEEDHSIRGLSFCNACVASAYEDATVSLSNKRIVSRKRMKLAAIVCIRGVHFTAFVRSGGGGESIGGKLDAFERIGEPWYFFDSMAGGSSEVKVVPKLELWLKEMANDTQQFYEEKKIPALVQRSLTDGHLCIYEPICYEN